MLKASLLLIALLRLGFLSAQDYKDFYYSIYQADMLFEKGDYSEALVRYETASEKVEHVPTRVLLKILKAAKKAKNKTLKAKYKSQLENLRICPKENAHIATIIDSIYAEDQRVRIKNVKLGRYYWDNVNNSAVINSEKFLNAREAVYDWRKTDSLNIQILLSIFEKHGFLDQFKIGYDSFRKVDAILLHFDKDTSNIVLQPILNKALVNGQVTPFRYALILDRHLYFCNKTQKFWTWTDLDSDPRLNDKKIAETIALRESIGMYGTELFATEIRGYWMLNNISSSAY